VHSFANNDRPGDYGGTIILVHEFHGTSFYTLYGHLSLNSLKNLEEGSRLSAGDVFADFGIPSENGHWPPHLHFQIIIDIGNYNGDYPGVCAKEDRDQYLANCPDPDLLLRLQRFTAGN
jgi:murein DD-endopeptidase MepM/ murein hydrolase activator NlpD